METINLPIYPGIGGALAFAAAYFLVGFPLKAVGNALYSFPVTQKWAFYTIVPFYSPRSWERSPLLKNGHLHFAFRTAILWLAICLSVYAIYWHVVDRYNPNGFIRAYMAFPAFYVLTEALGALFRLVFLLSGRLLPPVHNRPIFAHSLSHFWGRCWNRWVGDWLRHLVFVPLMRLPRTGILIAFAASGIWHELIITVPHYMRGYSVEFGPMAFYFVIQGIALLLEPRRWHPHFKRLYMYTVVIVPAPLVANGAFLHAFCL